jgi:hypothetical protein
MKTAWKQTGICCKLDAPILTHMKKTIYCLITVLILALNAYFSVSTAQGLTEVKDSIYSDILQEQRMLKVFVPDTWKPGSEENMRLSI